MFNDQERRRRGAAVGGTSFDGYVATISIELDKIKGAQVDGSFDVNDPDIWTALAKESRSDRGFLYSVCCSLA